MRNLWVQAKSTLMRKINIFLGPALPCGPILISFEWKLPEVFLYRFKTKKHMVNGLLFEIMAHKVGWVPLIWSILAIFAYFGPIFVHKIPIIPHWWERLVEYINTTLVRCKKINLDNSTQFSVWKLGILVHFWLFRGSKLPHFWPVSASYSHLFTQVSRNCTQIDCIFICFIILLYL